MALDGIVRMVDAFFRHCSRWLMQQPVVAAGAAGARGTAHRGKYRLFDFSLSDEEMRRIPAAKTEHPHRRPSGRRNGMSRRSTERPPGTDMPVFHPVNLRRRSLLRIEIDQHSIISRGINVEVQGRKRLFGRSDTRRPPRLGTPKVERSFGLFLSRTPQ